MSLIVVCGALANKPGNGGAAWTRLSWALGFRRLNFDVFFLEQIAPGSSLDAAGSICELERSTNLAYFRQVMERFGFGNRSALVSADGGQTAGRGWNELVDLADAADLLVNISGNLTVEPLKSRFRKRLFVDLDPGYTQFWHAAGLAEDHLRNHHFYFTIGENIGRPECDIPSADIWWRPVRQPVVLAEWPLVAHSPVATSPRVTGAEAVQAGPIASGDSLYGKNRPCRFTTVASWRGPYGRVTHNGVQFGVKAHEFRKFRELPARSDQAFEIALDAHPADRADVDALLAGGWRIADPKLAVPDPGAFRRYVQESGAEFSVAQGIYVDTRSGWFSDRSVRYLASGKPVLVQDTGFGRTYPVDCGIVSFSTLHEAVRGAARISGDYAGHARAAREIAERFFDSDKVLTAVLQEVAP
jgi:hypothetical protein